MLKNEFAITYVPETEKELLPEPKFRGIYWQGIPEEDQMAGQEIEINGRRSAIRVIGFQGSEGLGEVAMHQESVQEEDVFFISGSGEMTIWNGRDHQRRADEVNVWNHPLEGILTPEEAARAKYVLAIASDRATHIEGLVLNIELDDRTWQVKPAITPRSFHHGTRLDEKSLYFVVKHEPVMVDTHELVGYSGKYGGGE